MEGSGDEDEDGGVAAMTAVSDPPSTKNYSSASSEPLRGKKQETARHRSRRPTSRPAKSIDKAKRSVAKGRSAIRLPVTKDDSSDLVAAREKSSLIKEESVNFLN